MEIRISKESERHEILDIHRIAFGEEEGPVIAKLADDVLDDETAMPILSLVAVDNGKLIGHSGYYPRCGFVSAGELGFEAPYPIPEEHAAAWMIQELNGDAKGRIKGKVQCSEVLNQPQHWRA